MMASMRLCRSRASAQATAVTASASSWRTRTVTRLMMPVVPSASATRPTSTPESSRTAPPASTTRTATTFSANQPYSYEPMPAPPWASQPPTEDDG